MIDPRPHTRVHINPSPMGRGAQLWLIRYEEGKEFILDGTTWQWVEVPSNQDYPPTLRVNGGKRPGPRRPAVARGLPPDARSPVRGRGDRHECPPRRHARHRVRPSEGTEAMTIEYHREQIGESKLLSRLGAMGSCRWILADRSVYTSDTDSLGQTDYTFHDCIFYREVP